MPEWERTDGADNMTEKRNEADDVCANGTFGFEETDDNGAELITFCVTKQFKVMDSYFAGEYGTWACNRSIDKGYYHAALDHILASKELWGEVKACGVHIPTVRWNTDNRIGDIGRYRGGKKAGRRQIGASKGTSG